MVNMHLDIRPASDYPLPDLLNVLELGFEGYFVPIHFNLNQFLNMVRRDSIDLTASRVVHADGQPAGVALIARRGWTSRLAAMGIAPQFRNRKVGTWLMDKLIHDARDRSDREMVLEVIEQNESAVYLYKKFGFQVVRRLIGLIHHNPQMKSNARLQEIDLREMGKLILQYGLSDLPWQLCGEAVASMSPPVRAYKSGQAYMVISNPAAQDVVIHSLLVEPVARGNGHALELLNHVIGLHEGKTWHVPAIWPEEFGIIFERAGFEREALSQWQMSLRLLESESNSS